MKRPGQPNEVAPAFLFLACEDSSYITGAVLHPNGGEPTESLRRGSPTKRPPKPGPFLDCSATRVSVQARGRGAATMGWDRRR